MRQGWLAVVFVIFVLRVSGDVHAQADDCGTLDSISYPIDTNYFQLGQDYGTASERHQGRYHTGEDWFYARDATAGQPVRAVGRGVVTFSGVRAWGVDGGVVIIRHTLEDGSYVWSQYGHIEQNNDVLFPPALSCVEVGQIIGVIGDARPAPHLHFEMRLYSEFNPGVIDNPGPGYTRTEPSTLGYHRPAQIIKNLQAQLNRGYEWHSTMADFRRTVAPSVLNDQSLLVVDGDRLRRVTNDGRILWRIALSQPAWHVFGYAEQSFVVFADGTIAQVDVVEAVFLNSVVLENFTPDAPPLVTSAMTLYHTTDNELVAFSPDHRTVLWRVPDVPAFAHGLATPALVGLVIADELWTISAIDGTIMDQATLEDGVSLAVHPNGTLIAYTLGGLWQIDSAGNWTALLDSVQAGGGDSGAAVLEDGRVYVSDGEMLNAYNAYGTPAWEARLPMTLNGRITITPYDERLLLFSTHGDLVAVRNSGGICGFTGIYGDDRTMIWHNLGADGVLRVSIGDQLMGFDWQGFTNGC